MFYRCDGRFTLLLTQSTVLLKVVNKPANFLTVKVAVSYDITAHAK